MGIFDDLIPRGGTAPAQRGPAQLPPGFVLDQPAPAHGLPPGFVLDAPQGQQPARLLSDDELMAAIERAKAQERGAPKRAADMTDAELMAALRSTKGGERGPWEDYAPASSPWDDYNPQPPAGAADAFARGTHQGMTLNFGDELAGQAAAAGLPAGAGRVLASNPLTAALIPTVAATGAIRQGLEYLAPDTFGSGSAERYETARDAERAADRTAMQDQPVANIAGQVAGSLPAALAGGGAVAGLSLPARVGGSAAIGGLTGAAQGIGEGEDTRQRAEKALWGGALGTGLGLAGELAVTGAGALINKTFGAAKGAAPGVDPAARIVAADEFGIPLTRGQATGDVAQQAYEEASRNAARGGPAHNVMQRFDARQGEAMAAARQGIADDLGGQALPADQMGEAVQGALRQRASDLKNSSQLAYTVAGTKGATIGLDEVGNLAGAVGRDLDAAGIVISPNYGSYPGASSALNILKRVSGFDGAPEGAVAQSLSGLDAARKAIGQVKPGNAEDMRAIMSIRKSFDGWLDDAMDRSLFSGDPSAITDLKNARSLWSQYKGLTVAKPGDRAPAVIVRMQQDGVTGEMAANWLLGTANADQAGRAAAVAGRLKGILGKDSPEWEGLRQAAWTKMVEPARGNGGNQAVSTSMLHFLTGAGKPLAGVLFSPAEITQMRRLAVVTRNLVSDRKAGNSGQSGYEVARLLGGTGAGVAAVATGAGSYLGTGDPYYLGIAALPLLRNAASLSKGVAATKAVPSATGQAIGVGARLPALVAPGAVQGE